MFIAIDFFDAGFWDRVHGGSTHLPIALALTSALLDGVGSIAPSGKSQILNGTKGEMPAFGKKLTQDDVATLVVFIRSLSGK
jgi:hypothetical protein